MKIKFYSIVTLAVALSATAANAQVVTDGTKNASEGYVTAAIQTTQTQFGDAGATSAFNHADGGSELDGAYVKIENGNLCIFLAGNVESNFNKLEIFIDSKTGGQNVLPATNPGPADAGGFEDVNKLAGLKFDADFTADYWYTVTTGQEGGVPPFVVAAYYTELDPNGVAEPALANTAITLDGSYNLIGDNLGGSLGINNSNTAGVIGGTATADATAAEAVTTGVELKIPLSVIGSPASGTTIKINAFINGSNHDYASNQILAGCGTPQGNLAGIGSVDFSTVPGNQYFEVVNTTGVQNLLENATLNVTPNPVNEIVSFELTSNKLANETTVSISNALGQVVSVQNFSTQSGNNIFPVNVSDFATGMYFATLTNGSAATTARFVKN